MQPVPHRGHLFLQPEILRLISATIAFRTGFWSAFFWLASGSFNCIAVTLGRSFKMNSPSCLLASMMASQIFCLFVFENSLVRTTSSSILRANLIFISFSKRFATFYSQVLISLQTSCSSLFWLRIVSKSVNESNQILRNSQISSTLNGFALSGSLKSFLESWVSDCTSFLIKLSIFSLVSSISSD